MMQLDRSTLALLLGLVASMLLHATVLLPTLLSMMEPDESYRLQLRARFDPEDIEQRPEPPPEEERTRLGLDAENPSTMTWIGYEEYQEHLADLAETEQAAFTSSAAGTAQPHRPGEDQRDEQGVPQETATPQKTDVLGELERQLEKLDVGPVIPKTEATDPAAPMASDRKTLGEVLAALEPLIQPSPQKPSPDRDQPPQPVQKRAAASPEPPDVGAPADQESDPTSTVEVPFEDIKLGRPIAAHGLQLKPRKPRLTTLVRFTAAPINPLVEIRFRRDGRPARAAILRSSGDSRVDEAILNSLYRWRAAGKPLQALAKGKTIPVRIQIVVGRPR